MKLLSTYFAIAIAFLVGGLALAARAAPMNLLQADAGELAAHQTIVDRADSAGWPIMARDGVVGVAADHFGVDAIS